MGVAASIGCAIHCAAMPFVVAFLPMLGLGFLADEAFHKVMVVACTLLAVVAFIPGLRRHRRWLPIGVAAFGLSIIGAAAFALEDACCAACEANTARASGKETAVACTDECCEKTAQIEIRKETAKETSIDALEPPQGFASFVPWLTPFGGLLLVSAHLLNRRFSCRCGCCPT